MNQEGRRYRLDDVYYAPKASKQLLSEGKLFMNNGLIRTYSKNANQTGEFVLKKSDSGFSLVGKIVNNLFFVFEAKSGHHAYAITRSMVNDEVRIGDGDREGNSSLNQPIRNQDFEPPSQPSSKTSNEVPIDKPASGENIDDAIDDAILWHNRLTHRAISTLQRAGIVPKSVQLNPHWCKSCVEGKQTKLPYRPYEHNAKRTLW